MITASHRTVSERFSPALLCCLVALTWGSLAPAVGFASQAEARASVPAARSLSGMSPGLKRQLDHAFVLANQTVEAVATCRALFTELDQPASVSLRHTLYVPASGLHEQRICRRGVSAFTEVGSRVTYLCRGFKRLAAPRAAMTLVHEALHLAGLEEAPNRPGAPSSAEINGLVATNCRL